MRKLIVTPIMAAFLVVLVSFALTNTQNVKVGLWPTDLMVALPLSTMMLIAMAGAFFLGGLLLWLGALGAHARARRAEDKVKMLEAHIATLKARAATAILPPPG